MSVIWTESYFTAFNKCYSSAFINLGRFFRAHGSSNEVMDWTSRLAIERVIQCVIQTPFSEFMVKVSSIFE